MKNSKNNIITLVCNVTSAKMNDLVCIVGHHGLVGDISHGEDVRRVCCTFSSYVHFSVLQREEC